MVNPYQATAGTASHTLRRRAVRRYLVPSSLLIFIAILVVCAFLLVSTRTSSFDVEINGRPVSDATAIRYTVVTGILMSIVGLTLLALSFSNWRHNRKICNEDI